MLEITLSITTAFLLLQIPVYQLILKRSFGDRINKFMEDCKKTIESDIDDMIKDVRKMKRAEEKAEYFYDKSLGWVSALDVREQYFDLLKDVRKKYVWVVFLFLIQFFGVMYPEYVVFASVSGPVTAFTLGIAAFLVVFYVACKQTYEWLKLNEILTKRELGSAYKEIFKSIEEENE